MEKETIRVGLNNLKRLMQMRELKVGLDRGQVDSQKVQVRRGCGEENRMDRYKRGEKHSMWRQASVRFVFRRKSAI